ncbi:MAG: TetR/AcrR family transcriptional regulator [Chrysiogenetes bacterium]|nr:TetR/AcrR family transcriptional regulator [Chrysiogenetes bacterium]
MDLRAQNTAERKKRILLAARQIITAEGLDGLSMRKLAAEARLSVRTLYNIIGSREEILRALVSAGMDEMDALLEATTPLSDPIARARAVILVSAEHFIADPATYRPVLLALYREGTSVGGDAFSLGERAAAMQRVAIEAAMREGLLRTDMDATMLGWQIFLSWAQAMQAWAGGIIDDAGFRALALYGLYSALLGVAEEATRPQLLSELQRVQTIARWALQGACATSAKTEKEAALAAGEK